jgi:hypothetical protein
MTPEEKAQFHHAMEDGLAKVREHTPEILDPRGAEYLWLMAAFWTKVFTDKEKTKEWEREMRSSKSE